MKIKEFSITHYGPLINRGIFRLKNFNLFWGKNEEGKTLSIDALVKMILKPYKEFNEINRVDEEPEGYVIIEDENSKEIKIPEKGYLTEITELTSAEYNNIFVIRNSNLSISCENKFYINITDRLTGLKTNEISKIIKNLRNFGKITAKDNNLTDSDKDDKLKTRFEQAVNLIDKIEKLKKEIKEKQFDAIEENFAKQSEEIDILKENIKNFDAARKRDKYEKGKDALNKMEKALKEIENLEEINEKDREFWRDNEKDIKTLEEEKENLLVEQIKEEKEYEIISEKSLGLVSDFKIYEERKKIWKMK